MFIFKDLLEVFLTQTDSIFGILFLGLLWYFIWSSWGREQKFIQYFSEHQDFDQELEKAFRKIEKDMNARAASLECVNNLSRELKNLKDDLGELNERTNELKHDLEHFKDKLSNDFHRLEEYLNRDLRETREEFRDLLNFVSRYRKNNGNKE